MTPDSTRDRYNSPLGRVSMPQHFELSPPKPNHELGEGEFDQELADIMSVDDRVERENRRRKANQRRTNKRTT